MKVRNLPSLISSVAILACLSGSVHAANPIAEPDGRGGWIVAFDAESLNILSPVATLMNSYVHIEREIYYRPSCVISTPKIPVDHDDGYADFDIKLKAYWVGLIDYDIEPEVDIFQMFIETTSDKYARREYYHTGLMNKQVLYYGENGVNHYKASTYGIENFSIRRVPLKSGDEVRLKICRIQAGAKLDFKSVEVHTYPTEY